MLIDSFVRKVYQKEFKLFTHREIGKNAAEGWRMLKCMLPYKYFLDPLWIPYTIYERHLEPDYHKHVYNREIHFFSENFVYR